MDIQILWAMVIAFSAILYSIFDGFDLGVGILFRFFKDEEQRDTMVNSIIPVWDGNETWVVLMVLALFGGFPTAYSVLLPALYIPLVLMVVSLILRGVAMEFRFQSVHYRSWWDFAFSGGSILAAFCQGVVLGNLMEGIRFDQKAAFHDISFNFFSPFTMMTGITLVIAYALIGSTWLNFKTSGQLQGRIKVIAKRLVVVLALLLIIIIYGRFNFSGFQPRFGVFGINKIMSAASVSWYVLSAILLAGIYLTIENGRDWVAFSLNMTLTFVSAIYIVTGFWPYVVPPDLTIFDTGTSPQASKVLLRSAYVIIPILLINLIYSYSVFKGKVSGNDHYEPNLADNEVALKTNAPSDGFSEGNVIRLSWPVRILISLAGLFYFFLVLGFLGEMIAMIAIGIFIIGFLSASFLLKK